ncbi:MAG TPA: ABC transporter ATP-binding protein [Kofleriaceae bacterium]|nr:ABC transporter ATP-binding protein [Kofleriaceae bacterium]
MIRAENVSKYFGAKRALGPVSFEIEEGETVGFLGLNGAGKTTALRIFACDLRPSAGTVVVGNIDAVQKPHEVRKLVGFLPENPPLYGDMLVREYLQFAGRVRGMSAPALKKRMPEVLDLTDLTEVQNDMIFTLSHGFRQRVGVAQAIVHEPKLLILDEPTRGLDPVQIVEMRNLVRNLKKKHTVLISSHILTEISETCDRLLMLGDGEILASGTEESLLSKVEPNAGSWRISIAVVPKAEDDREAALKKLLTGLSGVSEVKDSGREDDALAFEVLAERDIRAELCRALVEGGHGVVRIGGSARNLENIFLKLVHGGERARN